MIKHIEHLGKFVDDCTLSGERRADGVACGQVNGMQISRSRFLILTSTLGFRGVDDNRSIVWQLRSDSYNGPVIREGMFAQSIDDWYPLGPKFRCVRQYGQPVIFGVPKGAILRQKPVPHANVFAVKWRTVGRMFVPEGGYIMWDNEPREIRKQTQDVQWLQFRLNDAEDDIEIIQPITALRQVGYEDAQSGQAICDHGACPMNQSFVQALPLSEDATQWIDVNHFNDTESYVRSDGQTSPAAGYAPPMAGFPFIAALRYRFNTRRGCYEWVQVGPRMGQGLWEASIIPYRNDWVIAARRPGSEPGIAWTRLHDPFGETPARFTIPADIKTCGSPLTAYNCADGIVRLCAGDASISPYQSNRNPMYLWDIDPDYGFKSASRRDVFDTFKAGVPIIADHGPLVDFGKILPHVGGTTQTLVHRVRTCAMAVKEADYNSRIRPLTNDDFAGTASYHAAIHYSEALPPTWTFEA